MMDTGKEPRTGRAWIAMVLQSGADKAALADVPCVPFRAEFLLACEQNICGSYNRNWMCPPHVGDIYALIAQAQQYTHAIVYQTIGKLEDSFDYEGMVAAKDHHRAVSARIQQHLSARNDILHLTAGACTVCERCAALDEAPCRYPALALPSLEAYGIAVSELAGICGLPYINGVNTVTYFGAILYDPKEATCQS